MTHEPKVGELPALPKHPWKDGGWSLKEAQAINAHVRAVIAAEREARSNEARKDEARVERLIEAIEGECEGLGIDAHTARAILHYVETGEPLPEVDRRARALRRFAEVGYSREGIKAEYPDATDAELDAALQAEQPECDRG